MCSRRRSSRSSRRPSPRALASTPTSTTSTPACRPGAIDTRRSATLGASTRATRMATASARSTSTPWRGRGPCSAPGSARTEASRKRSCHSILASSSSCTKPGDAAKLSSAPLSPLWSCDGPHHPGSRQEPRQIAGPQGRAAFVALAEHLKQQLGAGLRERHIAEFINDQQLVAGQLALQAAQSLLVPGFNHLMDQGRSSDEPDRQPFLTSRQAEPQREMGLAGAAVAERDDGLTAGDVFAAGQLQHQDFVERWQGQEVEAVEALGGREPGFFDPPLDAAALPLAQLPIGPAQQG